MTCIVARKCLSAGAAAIGLLLITAGAHAVTIFEDPGTPGNGAQDFAFDQVGGLEVDILWTDNKTLEWGAGEHVFVLFGSPNALYTGWLLDQFGNEIPDSEILGTMPGSADPLAFGFVNLPGTTVFSGMRLIADFDNLKLYDFNWNDNDRPTVGAGVVPVPAAVWLFGSGLLGLIGIARRKRAT